jgi:lambda family phage portal protein
MTEDEAHTGRVVSTLESETMLERYFGNLSAYPGQLLTIPSTLSPKIETIIFRDRATRAARQAVRNSEYLRSGIEKHVDMVVGPRLLCRPAPNWDLLGPAFADRKVRKAFVNSLRANFNDWAFDPDMHQDAEGHYDFGGLMWMAYHNLRAPEAETTGIIHYDEARRLQRGARWATFVSVIQPGRVQTPPMMQGREEDLGIFQGRQLDAHGAWEGLYVSRRHPADPARSAEDFDFYPRWDETGRTQAWHWFEKTEGGAQRGLTNLVTSLRSSGMFDKHDDAMLGAAIVQALFSSHIESDAEPEALAARIAPAGGDGRMTVNDFRMGFYSKTRMRIGEHRVVVLPGKDHLKLEAVNRAAQDPTAFLNHFLRRYAAVTGTTFEQIANNWSDANYSAARAALLDLWRGILRHRNLFIFIPSTCYASVTQEGIERRRIVLPAGAPDFYENRSAYCRVGWVGPAMGDIDPEKAAKAREIDLRCRVTNRQLEWDRMGNGDYYDGFEQIAVEFDEADDLGFELEPPVPGAVTSADQGQTDGSGADGTGQSGDQSKTKNGKKQKEAA